MLLTLVARSFERVFAKSNGGGPSGLLDLPRFARDEIGVTGLSVHSSMLAGQSADDLDRLRDAADKGQCPCLLLIEDTPQPLASLDESLAMGALDRVDRLIRAASRMGCSSVAMSLTAEGVDDDESRDLLARRLKPMLQRAERLEVSLMIAPGAESGLAATPESLTTLIRKIGGFRVGSFPNLSVAADSGDAAGYLKSTAPYASAVLAPLGDVSKDLKHSRFAVEPLIVSLQSVGFAQNLAIEYVGEDDVVEQLRRARELFESALGVEP